jgi:hypothetical protein
LFREIDFKYAVTPGIVQTVNDYQSVWHDCLELENTQLSGRQADQVMLESSNSPTER